MELLSYTFIQYAFLGGIAIAILAGLLGPFVVQSKQAVASDMFAHVALAGIGAALIADVHVWWGALPTLLIISTLIWHLLDSEKYSPDAIAMFFLSSGLATALALVHLAQDTVFSFEAYLFGSILTLNQLDILSMYSALAIVLLLVLYFWYPLIGATQSPRYILPHNRAPRLIQLMYFWMLAIVVWIGIKTIGGLLVGALLVIPVLVVKKWTNSFKATVVWSVISALVATIGGLFLALYVDIPPSSIIIGVLLLQFILQSLIHRILHTQIM